MSNRGFTPAYNAEPTNAQKRQYQQHQQAYQQMPSGTYDDLRRSGAAVDTRRDEYERRERERLRVEAETREARMERRDRTDPDIQKVRNARNRTESSLKKLDREQRKYNESASASAYANTINGNHNNMTHVASRNTMPNEMVGSVTQYADVPSYPQTLPAPRRQKEADRRQRRND